MLSVRSFIHATTINPQEDAGPGRHTASVAQRHFGKSWAQLTSRAQCPDSVGSRGWAGEGVAGPRVAAWRVGLSRSTVPVSSSPPPDITRPRPDRETPRNACASDLARASRAGPASSAPAPLTWRRSQRSPSCRSRRKSGGEGGLARCGAAGRGGSAAASPRSHPSPSRGGPSLSKLAWAAVSTATP